MMSPHLSKRSIDCDIKHFNHNVKDKLCCFKKQLKWNSNSSCMAIKMSPFLRKSKAYSAFFLLVIVQTLDAYIKP